MPFFARVLSYKLPSRHNHLPLPLLVSWVRRTYDVDVSPMPLVCLSSDDLLIFFPQMSAMIPLQFVVLPSQTENFRPNQPRIKCLPIRPTHPPKKKFQSPSSSSCKTHLTMFTPLLNRTVNLHPPDLLRLVKDRYRTTFCKRRRRNRCWPRKGR